ncbi:hypothetical protein [Pyxidicoccus xibeiensis]|uniref:hypothetical protein n=1 Tax=Pyxidicoccus xibeiensis TaxID=2906759 RepID=UPI0020A7A27B|nr:hypothetical protein [Pyxidicoccus xibeiensis]MCP3136663.1 hypothetical protein [Pyxidicoccus xibeiensis]
MYLGHVGVALASRRLGPGVPLAWLCTATVFLDFVDVAVDVAGLDNAFTAWSHTLLAAVGWSVLVGALGWLGRGRTVGLLLGALVLSHVLTDYVTSHLWLWRDGPRVGLKLYAWPWLDFGVEAAVIVAGWWLYRGSLSSGARRSPFVWCGLLWLLAFQVAFNVLGVARVP